MKLFDRVCVRDNKVGNGRLPSEMSEGSLLWQLCGVKLSWESITGGQ
jgi:hypothetical protein